VDTVVQTVTDVIELTPINNGINPVIAILGIVLLSFFVSTILKFIIRKHK